MFQKLWRRFFAPARSTPQQDERGQPLEADRADADTVVLYARFDAAAAADQPPRDAIADASHERQARGGGRRRSILGRKIARLGLCGPSRRQQLEAVGVETAEDLLQADLDELVGKLDAPPAARAAFAKYRRAIRLALGVPGLSPREALLLISIHRRSASSLASESPGLLYRDLQRFAWSSRGQRQLRGRPLPSPARVRGWVEAAAKNRPVAAKRRGIGSVTKRPLTRSLSMRHSLRGGERGQEGAAPRATLSISCQNLASAGEAKGEALSRAA